MTTDRSAGWEDVADRFMTIRSNVGAMLVRSWAREHLDPSTAILDVGCGSGFPIAKALIDDGFDVYGIDASPSLVAAFSRRFPHMPAACEPAQDSAFFGRAFAGVVAIGLVFLLDADDQRTVLRKVSAVLQPGGRFLFSAPRQACEWRDTLTGRTSMSLGEYAYARCLVASGLHLTACSVDEGGNDYFHAAKAA